MAKNKKQKATGNVKFGKMITKLREEKGLQQNLAAAKLGIGRAHLNHIEAGRKSPERDTLYAMQVLFGLDMDVLYKACCAEKAAEAEARVSA